MSDHLGHEFLSAATWFQQEKAAPYVLVRISEQYARSWADSLGLAVRRCYVADAVVRKQAKLHGISETEIIAACLPDAGATMAGDFGELLVYFYQGAQELPAVALGPKKWRLKQDRTKTAPHSDVVHFVLPEWPASSNRDVLLCAEVKTKSTNGDSTPIQSAINDCMKDRTSRLTRTLVWLREKALLEPLEDVEIAHLDRFLKATDHPAATKRFRAVAVICQSLVDEELTTAPTSASPDYTVVVIVVPELKNHYSAVFEAAKKSVPPVDSGSILPLD
jgi:hypothetical protein